MSAEAGRRWSPGGVPAAVMSFGALLALTYLTYGRVFEIRPLSGDNLYILSWAERAPASALPGADPDIYPEWRPLAFLTIWLQYRWSDIDQLAAYYVVNLVLWTACAWLVYRIVEVLAHSTAAALLAAAVVVTDHRPILALSHIVERQSSMACVFGLLALLVVVTSPRGSRLTWIGVSLLLLASALSKEYGLAFASAVAVYSRGERRYDIAAAAIAAAAMYAALRIGIAGGARGSFCEGGGYFFILREHICYERLDGVTVTQMAYNVAATGIGSVLPGVFTEDGQLGLSPRRLVASAFWMACAILGWWKGPRPLRLTVLVIGCVAALSFLAYRDHNQIISLCAFGIAVGGGLAVMEAAFTAYGRSRRTRLIAAGVVVGLLVAQSLRTARMVSAQVDDLLQRDPCDAVAEIQPLDAAFIQRVKAKYHMEDPECVLGR